jgi:Acetyltransferase (GNAT) domain
MISTKNEFQKFCEEIPDLPIFFESWWLDIVCGGAENWTVILGKRGDETVGIWPIFIKKKWNSSFVAMPPLGRFFGPFFSEKVNGQENRFLKEMIEKLPKLVAFEQDFYYSTQNWLPFFWKNFRQTTRYSYKISFAQGLDLVFQNMDADYRNNKIRKAEKIVSMRTDLSLADFWHVHEKSFERSGEKLAFDFLFLEKLDTALEKNNRRKLFFATDSDGNIHSAAYLIWDNRAAYLLMAGDDPQFRASGAGIWLIWQILQFAANTLKVKELDFLGSMIQPIARVRRQFGATPQPYFRVQKEWSIFWKIGKFFLR